MCTTRRRHDGTHSSVTSVFLWRFSFSPDGQPLCFTNFDLCFAILEPPFSLCVSLGRKSTLLRAIYLPLLFCEKERSRALGVPTPLSSISDALKVEHYSFKHRERRGR